jgi:hypothetical protein
VIAGAVTVLFFQRFRQQISGLIDRVFKIKFPGGELSASQQEKLIREQGGDEKPEVDASEVEIPAGIHLDPKEAEQVVGLLQSERANAALWEYRYLNYYLARSTQDVLDWLATYSPTVSLRLLDSHLQAWIPEANERSAIVQALQKHHLIALNGDVVTLTDKGREYRQWRGPQIPMLPALVALPSTNPVEGDRTSR